MKIRGSLWFYKSHCLFFKGLIIVLVIFFINITFRALVSAAGTEAGAVKETPATEVEGIEEKWGIKILGVRLTANEYMLDFRYRVHDVKKAAPIFDRKSQPYVIDQASGAKFIVPTPPKIGALRSTGEAKAFRNYFILFANPAKYVKKGNKVTVVIGDFRAEDLVVQ